jgi:hypothetical protein
MHWLRTTRHRRQFLGATMRGASIGLASLLVSGAHAPLTLAQATPPPSGSLAVRRNIYDLLPDSREVTSLRRGVARMKQLSEDDPEDPRGWLFQSYIHGAPEEVPERPEWRQCQHGTYFFLPWHRMFLYWFERILRWAADDPSLTLPYWDYSDPARRVLPLVFREPADDSNPLYNAVRDPLINAGVPPWSLLDPLFDYRPAFTSTAFSHADPLDTSFGGGRVSAPVHSSHGQPMGLLEATPHGQIHVMIGGRQPNPDGTYSTAWMGLTDYAARDPIFWLHHANIDRLWDRWIELGEGRENPIDDPIWMDTAFTFFDENGDPVEMKARDVLSTRHQLGYWYDDLPVPEPSGGGMGRGAGAPEAASEYTAAPGERQMRRRSLLGASRAGRIIELGSTPTTVPIRRETVDDPTAGVTPDMGGRLVLSVEGLRGVGVPGVSFEVYLHDALNPGALPPGDTFVGLLSLFGLQPQEGHDGGHGAPSSTQSFDVTGMVRAAMADPNRRGRLTATFVPRALGGETAPSGVWATAERVALSGG